MQTKTRKILFKATRGRKNIVCKRAVIRQTTDFLVEPVKVKRERIFIFQVLRENNYWPNVIFSVKKSFKN